MSNFWGLLKGAGAISQQALQTQAAAAVAPGARPTSAAPFAVDLGTNLQATTTGTSSSASGGRRAAIRSSTSAPARCGPRTGDDRRHAHRAPCLHLYKLPTAGVLQVCTSRIAGRLQSDGSACAGALPASTQLDNLIVDTYYVDRIPAQQAGLPLAPAQDADLGGGVVQFRDQESFRAWKDRRCSSESIRPATPALRPAT